MEHKHLGFKRLKSMLAKKGNVSNPGAVAAAVAFKKYGKEKVEKAAHEHKSMTHVKPKKTYG